MQRFRETSCLLAFALLLGGCGKDELTTKQKREKLRDSVAVDASIAAERYVEAILDCRIAGFDNLDQCAKNDGRLPAERTAQLTASMAVDWMKDYQTKCDSHFAAKHCQELVARAIKIEWRRAALERFKSTENLPSEDL